MTSPEDLNNIAQQIEIMLKRPIEPKYMPYPLRVSGKVVKQISTGIYRSPGNSIKELVSNSFDADAIHVYVLTGKPSFDSFRIYDDGDGMSAKEFTGTMQRIGASMKMPGECTRKGRPLIGRIGIGLLAVGHISRKFDVISGKEGETSGFEAKVDMTQMFEVETEARPLEELTAGTVQLRMYSKPVEQHYASIVVKEVTDVWKDQLGSSFQNSYFHYSGDNNYEEFVKEIQRRKARISKIAGYDQFLWELGLLSPVRYLEQGPVRNAECDTITELKNRMESYNINLFVDDVEIRKPILFPLESDELEPGSGYGVYPFRIETKTEDANVKAIGYIYHQAVRILPPELRGVLPRIRSVGVGLPIENRFRLLTESTTPIMTWQVFGEVYVDDGLDAALNIDRSSFFEADPSFVLLREKLEETMKERAIMGAMRKRQDDRRKVRRNEKTRSTNSLLIGLASAAGIQNPVIVHENRYDPRFLEFDSGSGTIKIFAARIPKAHEKTLLGVILCYQLSKAAQNREKAFYELLTELVANL